MNTSVTATSGGTNLAGNGQSRYFRQPQAKQPEGEITEAVPEEISRIAASHAEALKESAAAGFQMVDAVSFSQTQQGFLQIAEKALGRMGELSALCLDATKSDNDRASLTAEFTQLQNFISDIGSKRFNGMALFSGKVPDLTIADETKVPLHAIDLAKTESSCGLAEVYDSGVTALGPSEAAVGVVSKIEQALQNLGDMQAKVSSNLQRLKLSDEQLSILTQNLSAANNRINDLDWAKGITQTARLKMLGQTGAAMMAQANVIPESTLRLLD